MADPAIKAALKEATWTLARPHPGDAQQHVAAAVAAFLRALGTSRGSTEPTRDLARRYQVNGATVRKIRAGTAWRTAALLRALAGIADAG